MRSTDLSRTFPLRPLALTLAIGAVLALGGTLPSIFGNPAALAAQMAGPDAEPAPATGGAKLPLPEMGSGQKAAPSHATDGQADDDPAGRKDVAPPVQYELSALPEPVRRMRQLIVEAARTGDIEKLRPLLGAGADGTELAIGGYDGDPIAYLRSLSGDPGGQEVMAILLDVLDAGYVDMDPGTPEEIYVWPYFFATPIAKLTPPQRVELLRIVTAGDLEGMEADGGYNFFRVGITPDGEWKFFVAGD